MGLELRTSTVDASLTAIGYIAPVNDDGLVYLDFFGGSAAVTGRNLAPSGANVSVIGNPVESAKHTTFKPGTNFVRTSSLETADKTLIIVARPIAEAPSRIIGTYRGDRPSDETILSNGVNIFFGIGTSPSDGLLTPVYDDAGWSGVPGTASVAVPILHDNSVPVGSWCCLVGRTDANVRSFSNMTAGLSTTSSTTSAVDVSSSPYEVGSTRGFAGFNSDTDLAFAAIFERALSDDEIDTFYNYLKTYLATYASPILI